MFNFFSSLPAALARILLAMLLLALRLPAAAQAPAWQSARAVATATAAAVSNYSQVTATAVDAAGNVYLAGTFTNTVVLGGTTLTSAGGGDVFVAKFNPASNQFVWAQRAGGTEVDYASALALSGTSVYVAGEFTSPSAGFGPVMLTNAGAPRIGDVFVAKLTDAGPTASFDWAQRAGGVGDDRVHALAVSGPSVYVAGSFDSPTAGFGATTLTNADVALRASDVFVAKLTDAGGTGSFAWAQRAGGAGSSDGAYALALSGTSVYVAGYFDGSTVSFGPVVLTRVGGADVFVAKLTDAGPTGSFVWAQRAGGTGPDGAYALAVSGTSVYVAGGFNSATASFGFTTLTNASGNASTTDVFVAKLNDAGSTGNFAWAQRAGGTGNDQAYALALSGTSIYVAGYFNSPAASFGAITLTDPTPGAYLGFLASLTDATLTATTATAGPREPAALFPNPARRTATLRLPAGTPGAPLTLTDALGRAVRHYPAPAGPDAVLDLGGLPVGLYLLHGAGPAQRLVVE